VPSLRRRTTLKGVIDITKLVLGFDIDGVLTDDDNGQDNVWLTRASAYFNKPILKHSFYIDEALGVSPDELYDFLIAETIPILSSVPIRSECVPVLSQLSQAGHEIHLITAREEFLRPVTEDWLQRHGVPYTALHMGSDTGTSLSKGEKCRQLGVQFFVDDHYRNCLDTASRGVYTLLFNASHNRDWQCPPAIARVYNWLDIAQHIAKLTG